MYDINFFKNINRVKSDILKPNLIIEPSEAYDRFEAFRRKKPFIFNIETTNVCNMKCIMCPRPKLMKRPLKHMDMGLFEKIIKQIKPHNENDLSEFWKFVSNEYLLKPEDRNENAFYFYTLSKSITLHGYGEPPLDPYLRDRIALCTKHNIPTYFSCVPANINVEETMDMMRAGLGAIKFAMDSLDDDTEKKIRGGKSNFTDSYKKICELLELKMKDPSIKTNIVITMIELSRSKENVKLSSDFMKLWQDKPVYAYVKSMDNKWLNEDDSGPKCKSHYETQYCEFPWMSMTVMADGSVVPCTQDYNCEMVLGNADKEPLEKIWNSIFYDRLRRQHINGDFHEDYKCVSRCDIKKVHDRLKEKKIG